MKRLTFIVIIFLTISKSFAQKIEKVLLDKNDLTRNFYTIIYPTKLPYSGYLVLIPGFGETAEKVLQQTDLPIITAQNGILTIIPTLQDGVLSFGIDSLSQHSLNLIIQDVRNKHKLIDQRFFIGGFSIGGSCAIKFAQETKLKPTAIFAIDPPLDFERFYNSATRDLRLTKDRNYNQENLYMVDRIEKVMGGKPKDALSNYYRTSPYSYSDTSQFAIKKIQNLPIRIYCEPDIQWWLKQRHSDFTNINVIDCSAMINELQRLGNNDAVLMTTEDKGFRNPNHQRHPHSWSIVENNDLVKWLIKK